MNTPAQQAVLDFFYDEKYSKEIPFDDVLHNYVEYDSYLMRPWGLFHDLIVWSYMEEMYDSIKANMGVTA